MIGQDPLKEFENFAGNLIIQYSNCIPENTTHNKSQLLHSLDRAMFKMENELTGRLTDIMTKIEQTTSINTNTLEQGLEAIKSSSIKELLKRNFLKLLL